MLSHKIFSFNPFRVSTHLLYDETGECAIFDPGCYGKQEEEELSRFIEENKLKPVLFLFTHCHIDHILGARFVSKKYKLKPLTHPDSMMFLENAREYGKVFDLDVNKPVLPDQFIEDGDELGFGNQKMRAIHCPGHAAGSLCYYHENEGLLISGDVLFHNSIGRTDLPTGDHDTLIKSINEKLMVLPDNTRVFPGHGPETSIGYERKSNPYLNGVF